MWFVLFGNMQELTDQFHKFNCYYESKDVSVSTLQF